MTARLPDPPRSLDDKDRVLSFLRELVRTLEEELDRPAASDTAYTPSNVTPTRTYDADASSVAELADVLGTLIDDLQDAGYLA